jgi:hypothetical protein
MTLRDTGAAEPVTMEERARLTSALDRPGPRLAPIFGVEHEL